MSSPYGGHDPETPPGAEQALKEFSDSLEAARQALRMARDQEVTIEVAYKRAHRKALLSAECPKVRSKRDDGSIVTVAERDAWVEDQCADEELALAIATANRQAARDLHDTLRTQGSLAQSLSKSVADSYRGTGGHKW